MERKGTKSSNDIRTAWRLRNGCSLTEVLNLCSILWEHEDYDIEIVRSAAHTLSDWAIATIEATYNAERPQGPF